MSGYKESVKLWKQKSFRTYISDEKKKYDLNKIEDEIQKLVCIRNVIESETDTIYTHDQGNTVKKLKSLLPWEDMKPFVKVYNKKYPNNKTSGSIIRFFNELLSG